MEIRCVTGESPSETSRHTHTHNTYTTRVHIRFRPQLPFLYASVLSCYFPPLVPYPFSLLLLLTSYNIILHQEIKFEEKIRERKHCLVVFAINIFERRSYRELYVRRTRRVRCVTSRAPGKHDTPSSSISFHTLLVLLPCQQRSSSMRVLRPDVTRRSTSSISLSISFYLFRFEIYLIFFPKKISVSRPPHE